MFVLRSRLSITDRSGEHQVIGVAARRPKARCARPACRFLPPR
jgi:hypothetical protein